MVEIVRSGPIAPVARGPQAPPTIEDRVAHSTVIAVGVLRCRPDQGRQFIVEEVVAGDRSSIAALAALVLPPFPAGDHRIVVMAACDRAGDLRLTGDPRHLDPDAVLAAVASATAFTDADADV